MESAEKMLEWTVDGMVVFGPVSVQQLRDGVSSGRIPATAHTRPAGTSDWLPASQIAAALAAPRPPPTNALVLGTVPLFDRTEQSRLTLESLDAQIQERKKELESVEEALQMQEFGFYRPRYGLESSAAYAERLKVVREQQKAAVKQGTATACSTNWVIGGSAKEGQKMVERMSKLMLRAFNAECDAAVTKTKFDNVVSLEQRISKAAGEINKLAESNKIAITNSYVELKLAELHLVYEHRQKVHDEKEAQRDAKEQLKEELRAQEEIERAQREAEAEEERHQTALAKARAELAAANPGVQVEKLELLVTRLEKELKETLDRKAKAIARAQLTRSGHVYVISNVGSFGPDVYKIGLTRRFEPLERVNELGDAAVPFPFDVHAIIYSEDAPALETALHHEFANRRVNLVNARKEYFRVSLSEIQEAVAKHFGTVTFTVDPDAEQWRQTTAILNAGSRAN